MARDGSWSSGSWKSSPWKYGPRRTAVDSGAAPGAGGAPAGGATRPTVLAGAGGPHALAGSASPNTPAGSAGGARLADLREWHIVEARCARCRHVGRLRPKQLTAFVARRPSTRGGRQFAGQTRLADILERFACSECGNRAGNDIAVVTIERNV